MISHMMTFLGSFPLLDLHRRASVPSLWLRSWEFSTTHTAACGVAHIGLTPGLGNLTCFAISPHCCQGPKCFCSPTARRVRWFYTTGCRRPMLLWLNYYLKYIWKYPCAKVPVNFWTLFIDLGRIYLLICLDCSLRYTRLGFHSYLREPKIDLRFYSHLCGSCGSSVHLQSNVMKGSVSHIQTVMWETRLASCSWAT